MKTRVIFIAVLLCQTVGSAWAADATRPSTDAAGLNGADITPRAIHPSGLFKSEHGIEIDGVPTYSTAPTGNPFTTLTNFNLETQTASATTREYGMTLGMLANTGTGQPDPQNGKVTLYVGMRCLTRCIAAWATNPLATLEGPLSPDFYSIDVDENDLNLTGHSDAASKAILGGRSGGYSTYGKVDTTKVIYVGNELMTGLTYDAGVRANYGIAMSGESRGDGGPLRERGIWYPPNGARLADLQSDDSSQAILADFGSHQMGIDFSHGSYARAPLVLPHGTSVHWTTAAGGEADPIFVDDNNPLALLHLGHGTASVVMEASAYPSSDNNQSLGTPGLAFSQVAAKKLNVAPSTPASSHAPCVRGDQLADANYIYVCTAANHWRRAALADF